VQARNSDRNGKRRKERKRKKRAFSLNNNFRSAKVGGRLGKETSKGKRQASNFSTAEREITGERRLCVHGLVSSSRKTGRKTIDK